MEDDNFKDIFAGFNPSLSSDNDFMQRLDRSLRVIESVKAEHAAMRRANRRAVFFAAVVGFIAGMLTAFAIPMLEQSLTRAAIAMPQSVTMSFLADNYMVFALALVGGTATFLALNTYQLTLFLSRPHRS